jgi:hypothetical protein
VRRGPSTWGGQQLELLKRFSTGGSKRYRRHLFFMENLSQCGCSSANGAAFSPSFPSRGFPLGSACGWKFPLKISLAVFSMALFLAGCGADASKPADQAAAKPAEPAVPEEIQSAASALLGSESQVLVFGDLAKNGKREFLVANVVPKTPTNNLPGTIITRAVVAEEVDGKWEEVFRCDEHLKNSKGYLGLTPLVPVTGWRLQYEQSADKGLALYFTPLKGKRYQSLDRTFEHFLPESPSLQDARSVLR